MTGGFVCRVHGGSAPQVRAAARRRLVEARIVNELSAVSSVDKSWFILRHFQPHLYEWLLTRCADARVIENELARAGVNFGARPFVLGEKLGVSQWSRHRDSSNMRSLTTAEAAQATGLNIETIRQYLRSGRLKAERVGRMYLVDRSAVRQLAADPPRPGRPRRRGRAKVPPTYTTQPSVPSAGETRRVDTLETSSDDLGTDGART